MNCMPIIKSLLRFCSGQLLKNYVLKGALSVSEKYGLCPYAAKNCFFLFLALYINIFALKHSTEMEES